MPHHLKVESLSKSFALGTQGGRCLRALEEVSFVMDSGDFLGVVGRSGSGKSSLLRCLYRRYMPSSGRILYASQEGLETDLAVAADREILDLRRQELGYVSQFLRAIPRTPALDVVAEPLLERGEHAERARERAASTLDTLGIPEQLWDVYPATMSGGEQQRVNLARALISSPRLLLLDEPTSALDPETRTLAIEAILKLKHEGTTMIGVFHEAHSLASLADTVLAMESGYARWCGPAEEATAILEAV